MTYLREFQVNGTTLLGAALGVALGAALNHYMINLFAPELIAAFGWEKSRFALVGTLGLATMFTVPFWGRFVDRYGARVSASIGFIAMPASFIAFSFMTGDIYQFFAITVFQNLFGVLTTTLVFTRVVIQKFDAARGMALSVLMSGPPLIGAAVVPLVGQVIDAEGWRAGYHLLAAISALGGIAAILLVGRERPKDPSPSGKKAPAITWPRFVQLVRRPAFVLMVAGMFFCNVPTVLVSSQLKLVLVESGASGQFATWIISVYAVGVIIGRFASGLALDKCSPQAVALTALGLPAVGFLILASPADQSWLLASAVLLVGLAQGAEGDIGAYVASRTFHVSHFSLVYSFLIASMGLATAVGAVLLSSTLRSTGRFDVFLLFSAGITIVGALCFFLTGRGGKQPEVAQPLEAAPSL
ncbi:MFS transporter [Novosphingobium panipatense]|uniref:Major Facilitator Superfamily protein n=2 Tax=Novosphingobium panipatense TaxID=428991 RepID=A0ABY1QMY4_9SPHN|nr:MFS transporter [Novosphingobium panipatense]SMP74425.1 Major Facilitator Superfamily protein [Novosphingobium panipatense]